MVITTRSMGAQANPASAPVLPGSMSDAELAVRQRQLDEQIKAVNEQRAVEVAPQLPITGKDELPEQTLKEVVTGSDRGPIIANPASQPLIDKGVMQTSAKASTEGYADNPVAPEELAGMVDASTGVQTYKVPAALPEEPPAEEPAPAKPAAPKGSAEQQKPAEPKK